MTKRFYILPVRRENRPTAIYEYFVTGSGEFPFDMLRYDSCWPASAIAAAKMCGNHTNNRSILMRSWKEPTIDRWASFVWSVGLEKL